VKLGVDAKITDGISIGAVIQPQMQMDEFSGFKTFLNNFGYTGDASIPLPNEYGIGAKFAAGKSMISWPISCTTSGRATKCSSSSAGRPDRLQGRSRVPSE